MDDFATICIRTGIRALFQMSIVHVYKYLGRVGIFVSQIIVYFQI